jgi:hypothetical protein
MSRLLSLLFAILLAGTFQVYGGGTIRGSVKSSDTQEILPKTYLHFYTTGEDSLSRTIETSSGYFALVDVPAGEYTCRINHVGYRPLLAVRIQVGPSVMTDVEFLLQPCRSPADSASLDIYDGGINSPDKIRIYTPPDKDYR